MALRSGLSVVCYTAPYSTGGGAVARRYTDELEQLRFTTVNPGGYGELQVWMSALDLRTLHPEFALFSRIILMDQLLPVWLGEITTPAWGMQRGGKEYIRLDCLGLGNSLRDDPYQQSFTNQTVQQMAQTIINGRNVVNGTIHTAVVDPDTSALFPDNPAGTYSPAYDASIEEQLAALCLLAGTATTSYTWWTRSHPGYNPAISAHADPAGYPMLQVVAQKVDKATTTYQASIAAFGEVESFETAYDGTRAYNYISTRYNNGTVGLGKSDAVDLRLTAVTLDQGTAPFRFRKLQRDYSATQTINAGTAANISAALRAQYKDPTTKTQMRLKACRDATGLPVELYWLNAFNTNIAVPEAAQRGTTALPTTYTGGVTQFYILSTTYQETSSGEAYLDLTCDNFTDRAQDVVNRLQLAAETLLRSQAVAAAYQKQGASETGQCGVSFNASGAGVAGGASQTYPQQTALPPTSITLSQLQNNNATGAAASQITAVGFHLKVNSVAAGPVDYVAAYTTVGNCLRGHDRRRGTVDHHCDVCQRAHEAAHGCGGCAECEDKAHHRGLSIREHVEWTPGSPKASTLVLVCPHCGTRECFDTGVAADHPRSDQARLIRSLMTDRRIRLEVRD